jgi:hypothetical protein
MQNNRFSLRFPRFGRARVFKPLQIPFLATLLLSHPCKTLGVSLGGLCASASVPSVLGFFRSFFRSRVCFQQLAASFSLFALFSHTPAFVFSGLQPLSQKHRGMGVSEDGGVMVGAP